MSTARSSMCRCLNSMSADLPEIAEADAAGEVAALYETIRAETGSRLVNYVWRHLATIEGAGPWLWEVVRLNDAGWLARAIDERANAAAQRLAPEGAPSLAPATVAHRIVERYNVNNAGNLARVLVLLEAMRRPAGEIVDMPASQSAPVSSDAGVALPALPRFSDLSAEDLDHVEALAGAGPAADSGIVPSLWRHLAVEPGLLASLRGPLARILASPGFAAAFADLRRFGLSEAARMEIRMPPPGTFDRTKALDGLERFSRRIAELTLAGRILTRQDPASTSPGANL